MVFDDEIFLTFNHFVLASSFDYSDRIGIVNGLQLWEWSKLKLTHYVQSGGGHPYCLGASSRDGTSPIPKTQTTGAMTLSFNTNAVIPWSAKAIVDKRYDFGFITTGENHPDTDCSHLDFHMSIALDYVEIPKQGFLSEFRSPDTPPKKDPS